MMDFRYKCDKCLNDLNIENKFKIQIIIISVVCLTTYLILIMGAIMVMDTHKHFYWQITSTFMIYGCIWGFGYTLIHAYKAVFDRI